MVQVNDPGVTRTLFFVIAVAIALGLVFVGTVALVLARLGRRKISAIERRVAIISSILTVAGVACMLWGWLVEADWLETTYTEVATSRLAPGKRIRIVLLSDLHITHRSRALAELPDRVNALEPDLLIFTGDSIATRSAAPVLKDVLGSI